MNLATDVLLHAGLGAVDVALYTLLPIMVLMMSAVRALEASGAQDLADVRGLDRRSVMVHRHSLHVSSLRCGRSRSGHPARLAGYLGGQVINSGEEQFENRRGVCLVVT